jgi:hypothetical protein
MEDVEDVEEEEEDDGGGCGRLPIDSGVFRTLIIVLSELLSLSLSLRSRHSLSIHLVFVFQKYWQYSSTNQYIYLTIPALYELQRQFILCKTTVPQLETMPHGHPRDG